MDKQDGNFGLAVAAISEETPYLGDREVVAGIVRVFFSLVISALMEGEGSGPIEAECGLLGRTFTGQVDAYQPVPEWNVTGGRGLGKWLRQRMGEQVNGAGQMSDADLVAEVFAIGAHSLVEIADKLEEDGDEEDAATSTEALIEDYTSLFLGIPNEDDIAPSMQRVAAENGPVEVPE